MLTRNGSLRMILAHVVADVAFDAAAVQCSDSDVNGEWRGLYLCTDILVAVKRGPAAISRTVHCDPTHFSRRIKVMLIHSDYRLRDSAWKNTTDELAATSELR